MVLSSFGHRDLAQPDFGLQKCSEIAREGYQQNKSIHQIVVQEQKLITQERWDELFCFENLIHPNFQKIDER